MDCVIALEPTFNGLAINAAPNNILHARRDRFAATGSEDGNCGGEKDYPSFAR